MLSPVWRRNRWCAPSAGGRGDATNSRARQSSSQGAGLWPERRGGGERSAILKRGALARGKRAAGSGPASADAGKLREAIGGCGGVSPRIPPVTRALGGATTAMWGEAQRAVNNCPELSRVRAGRKRPEGGTSGRRVRVERRAGTGRPSREGWSVACFARSGRRDRWTRRSVQHGTSDGVHARCRCTRRPCRRGSRGVNGRRAQAAVMRYGC